MNRYALYRAYGGFILLTLIVLLLLLLFAWLGSHSRLILDDYLHVGNGLELGPWQNMLNQRNFWNGSYTDYLLHALVAPLGTGAPGVIPATIILIWLIGLVWLVYRVLSFARIKKYQRVAAVVLGAAITAVSTLR